MHCLAVGVSRSGKTTLCKALASAFNKSAVVGVYDPLLTDWDADFVTDDFRKFVEFAQANTSGYMFVDEAYTIKDKEHRAMLNACLTRGRHYGHSFILISQRFTLVEPTARNQCERVFVFKQAPRDADALYDDYCHPEIKELPKFQRGEYLDMTTFEVSKRKIF